MGGRMGPQCKSVASQSQWWLRGLHARDLMEKESWVWWGGKGGGEGGVSKGRDSGRQKRGPPCGGRGVRRGMRHWVNGAGAQRTQERGLLVSA